MAKCGRKLDAPPHVCNREGVEPDGSCCAACSVDGLHTPACWIATYPNIIGVEYTNSLSAEVDIFERLVMATNAVRIVQREVMTINRVIWNLQMGHKHRTLQSLLHHLEVDLRYIDQEIKGITG